MRPDRKEEDIPTHFQYMVVAAMTARSKAVMGIRVREPDPVYVTGAGPVGVATVALLAVKGATEVPTVPAGITVTGTMFVTTDVELGQYGQ